MPGTWFWMSPQSVLSEWTVKSPLSVLGRCVMVPVSLEFKKSNAYPRAIGTKKKSPEHPSHWSKKL